MLQEYPSRRPTSTKLLSCDFLKKANEQSPYVYEIKEICSEYKILATTRQAVQDTLDQQKHCPEATKVQVLY